MLYDDITNLFDKDFLPIEKGEPIFIWLNKHKSDIENIEKFYIDNFAMLKQKLKEKEQTILELQEQSIRDDQVQVIENNRIKNQLDTWKKACELACKELPWTCPHPPERYDAREEYGCDEPYYIETESACIFADSPGFCLACQVNYFYEKAKEEMKNDNS